MQGERADLLRPTNLSKQGSDSLIIDWNDGHRSMYTWRHLRDNCPCASCRGESEQPADPFRILKPSELTPRPPLAPTAMAPVGHYAYKITWNDGHDTGIYTLETLRSLCQCSQCTKASSEATAAD